ncbi:hypothetical protein [Paenibacillus popilliae]|uniref:Uncharacterized protein n=1 Tax=Paenibacillus popilliae ATCC 14706 TaxID=1212764 RepID=M9LCE6_PAEPP|nr:hypothetical protein [Paenibacillus popilliae]GAC43742.1 hypothetical protein PPOP_3142 [Paenibacillus popilliae ATCC 14706]
MKIIEISYPPYVGVDVNNSNIDAFVDMEDGVSYTVTLWTPNNYYWYMDKEKINHVQYGGLCIHVKSLTEDNINKAIEDYARDEAYFLKLSFLWGMRYGALSVEEMNRIIRTINNRSFLWEGAPDNELHELDINDIEYPLYYKYGNKDDGCTTVLVKANDGMTYKTTVVTPNYYYWYMRENGIGYMPASPPHLMVRSLTKEYIQQALEYCLEDNGYNLKFNFIAQNGYFDMKKMNKMLAEIKKEQNEFRQDE